ncbi:hypothetical protein SS50377_23326 [Spironucleus salmonicida]|uniref:Uncharacterized protein n=1 Tax=Spironucleus salmonicida TaxID=348837 RepID=V6LU36_9EUKA|nr:hypothetical protein SS50377_23326 [Spironucleus salmonicida]|eukprot:EST47196.1 Hypothetical protein SS50377_12706 [Spironucleus salmonicida]
MNFYYDSASPQSSINTNGSARSSTRRLGNSNPVYHDILSYFSQKADQSQSLQFDTPLFVCQSQFISDVILVANSQLKKEDLNISKLKNPYNTDSVQLIEEWESDLVFQDKNSLARICMLLKRLEKHRFLPPDGYEKRALQCLKQSYSFIIREIQKDYSVSIQEEVIFISCTQDLMQQAFNDLTGQEGLETSYMQ